MATETEIQRMVVRFTTDLHQMKKGMDQAIAGVNETVNKIDKKLADADSKIKSRAAAIGESFKRIGSSAKAMGRTLSFRVTAPIVAMAGASVAAFTSFDKAMTESTSIMKVTEAQVDRMKKTAIELSTQGAQGPKDLAEAYFFLASAGKDAEQSMALLPKVQKFATAGAFDMALATDLLTDAQSALGMTSKDTAQDAENLARLADVLVKANTLANASVQQFSIALTSKAGSSLKAFNKDAEEGVAVLAAFADQGVKAELAGNQLDRVIRLLSKASMDNAAQHKELGFQVFDAEGKMRNMADIVGNLETILEGMSDETKVATLDMLGFEARVQQAILPLLGMSEKIREYENGLRSAGGITDEVANKQMQSLSNRLAVAKNRLTAVAIQIGERLVPVIEKMIGFVERAVKWWDTLSEEQQKNILKISALVAVIGPALVLLGTMVTTIGTLVPVVTALAGAVTAAGLAFTAAAAAGVGLGVWLTQFHPAIVAFNREMEKTVELTDKWVKAQNKLSKQKVTEALQKDTVPERIEALQRQLELTEKDLEGKNKQLEGTRKKVGEFGVFERATGNKLLEVAKQEVIEQEKAVQVLEQRRDMLEDILAQQTQIKNFADQSAGALGAVFDSTFQFPLPAPGPMPGHPSFMGPALPEQTFVGPQMPEDYLFMGPQLPKGDTRATAPAIKTEDEENRKSRTSKSNELLERIALATELTAASTTGTIIADKVI